MSDLLAHLCGGLEVHITRDKNSEVKGDLSQELVHRADAEHVALHQICWLITHSMESNVLCVFLCDAISFVNPYVG